MGPPHSFYVLLRAFLIVLLLSFVPFVRSAVTNTTFDDTSSAFTFDGSWTATSASNPCGGCSSKPDASQAFGATWHDGNIRTDAPRGTSGSFTFTGSAVYIYGIDQAVSQPNIAFSLGDVSSVHYYTGNERFVYNALFFSATGLAAGETHTVSWVFNVNPSTGVGLQSALFDYAVVTSGSADVVKPPGTTTSSTSTSTDVQRTQTTTSPPPSSTTTTQNALINQSSS
ncbi:hypothetical protein B0H15DRAFT_463857 [Mycena belliarum]|uniref:Uncharacterized protein n=1 Tax=Mycena belliarum TaxID=1033014 RepID=A0AAD6XY31_9AGAR|nr:hypothetical protein B0H15DRAFT_463857 [Mycena belliae]